MPLLEVTQIRHVSASIRLTDTAALQSLAEILGVRLILVNVLRPLQQARGSPRSVRQAARRDQYCQARAGRQAGV
jgi:hypothetical protein